VTSLVAAPGDTNPSDATKKKHTYGNARYMSRPDGRYFTHKRLHTTEWINTRNSWHIRETHSMYQTVSKYGLDLY